MRIKFKRKLYPRGGSYETTIPLPLLFSIDNSKKYNVVFELDPKTKNWIISFEERRKSSKPKEE